MNKDKMEKSYCTAIVLAAGSGKRMGTTTHKQYLLMGGHPVLFYSLRTFQEQEYCRKEIVDQYGFTKVSRIVEGGAERFNSVWNGLQVIKRKGYVYIHDGARPFIDEGIIERAYECVCKSDACIAGTDDAMVVEKMLNHEVQVFTGKYENIKITTPEDLVIAEAFLGK